MRVVCDNCGAVYKISESKLVKEVNRATCKRCGHKILITRPGSSAAATELEREETGPGTERDQTVVKSSPDLPSAPQPSVPSIGSLTAELRAITIPGIESVGGNPAGAARLGPSEDSEPDSELTERRDLGSPSVIPAAGIPPGASPTTRAYRGPGPSISAEPAAPSTADVASPMSESTHPAPVPPPSVEPSNGAGSAVVGPGMVSARSGAAPPSPSATTAPVGSTMASGSAADGSAVVLRVIALCAGVGFVGLVLSLFVGGQGGAMAYGVAGLGLFGCLCLAALTDGGRKPGRMPVALILAFVVGVGVGGVQAMQSRVAPSTPQPSSEPTLSAEPSPGEPSQPSGARGEAAEAAGDATADATGTADPDPALGVGLTEEELAEARRLEYEAAAEASAAGATSEPEADARPTKASKSEASSEPTPDPAEVAARKEARKKRDEERREEARKREEKKREAKREEERKKTNELGGPKRAKLNKPDSGASKDSSSKSSGPKPFVIDTIIRNNGNIKRCLEAERSRGQDLSGKIFLQFTISPDGSVSRAKLTTSRWAGTPLDKCISRHVNNLEFPAFDGSPKKIKYALVIQ